MFAPQDSATACISRRGVLAAFGAAAILGISGCSDGSPTADAEPVTVRVGALRGPTGMGLVGLMDADGMLADLAYAGGVELAADTAVGTDPAGIGKLANSYEFTLAGSADELAPQLIQGDLDCLCVPANLAATLYQRTEGEVEVVAVNTLGVLDIVERGEAIETVADLAGKTVVSAGRGSTPQYALEYILRANGLEPGEDVVLEWKSEHAECLAALVAMLPQPFATSALAKLEDARIAIDLTDAWEAAASENGSDAQLITGVMVCRREFVDSQHAAVEELLRAYAASVDFVNEDASTAAELIGAAGIVDETIAERAIPYCHIVCVTGEEMRSGLEGYLETLYDADPESVGGALPEADFYLV